MPEGVIETGAVHEVLPVSGVGIETSAKPLAVKETAPVSPAEPRGPSKGRAMDRLFEAFDKKVGSTEIELETPPLDETKKPKASPKKVVPETKEGEPATVDPETEITAPPDETMEGTPLPADDKGKRQSPWKVVETYKQRTKKLEQELAELKGRITPENDLKALHEKIENAEHAIREREDFIRLHKYQQSDEFKEKYQKPYEQHWMKAAKYMSEITVVDQLSGMERPATVKDMEQLVNAPLGRARKMAEEMFGSFANDAMTMREKIVELYDQQNEAIEKVKKEGLERERTEMEKHTRATAQMRQEFAQHWARFNEELLKSEKFGQYFKPREGDEEWNNRLSKATEMIDKAFATMRPHITDRAQLQEAIQLHAIMRQRAIAFGPLRHENETLKKDRDAWKAKYEAIAKSTPPAGQGASRDGKPSEPIRARDRLWSELDKRAV